MATASESTVQSFYLAYYGRPADPSGLTYWAARLDSEGSFDSLVASFGVSSEATELFAGMTQEQQVNGIYQSLFGRDADAEGLAFYLAGLADGSFTLQDISKRVLDGATTGDDAAIIANKLTVAQEFTDTLASDPELEAEYVGLAATTSAKAIVTAVDATAASVSAASSSIAASFNITVHTLTSSADAIVGGAARDRITGSLSNLAGTLQATDSIDGGDGTSDRLTVGVDVDFTGFSTGYVKNVETIVLTNNGSTTRDFNATGTSGVKTFSVDGTNGVLTLSGMPTGVETIALSGQSGSTSGTTFTAKYQAGAAEQSASTTSVAFNVSGVGSSTSARVTATLDDVNTLAINASGSNFLTIGGTDATKVTVAGDGTLNTTVASGSAITSFDASTATGAISVDLTGVTTANAVTSVKTGSGADTITLAVDDIKANATVDGGSGTDTLKLSAASGATAAYVIAGVETVRLGSITGDQTFAASGWSDVGTLSIQGGSSSHTNGTITVAGLGAKNMTVEVLGASVDTTISTAADLSVDNSGSATLSLKADSAAAKALTGNDSPVGDVTFSEASSLTVDVAAGVGVDGAATSGTPDMLIIASKATAVTVNVATGKTAAGVEQTEFGGRITAPKATSVTVVSDGGLDNAQLVVKAATSVSITNGATAGTVRLDTVGDGSSSGTGKLTSLSLTSGSALTVVTEEVGGTNDEALTKLQNLTIAANKGLVTITDDSAASDLAAINTITLSGSGTGSAVALGDLGQVSNAYDLTITSSGTLNGTSSVDGVSLGNIAVTKGNSVSIDLTGVTGEVTVGNVGGLNSSYSSDTSYSAGNVTVKAPTASTGTSSNSGGLTVGNIYATGAVVVDASSAKTASIGTITGNSVNVDLSNISSTSYTLGNISAKSSATLALSQLGAATTLTIASQSASTGLAVDVTGGVNVETLNVTGTGSSLAAITLTGNLGAGTDLVSVDGSGSKAKSISLAGLANYENSTITGSTGADTIVGGVGVDLIKSGTGADVLTGGAGADVFYFNDGDSLYTAVNEITDLGSTDTIRFGGAALTKATAVTTATASGSDAGGITGASASYEISSYGVVTFTGTASGYDTFAEKCGVLSVAVGSTDGAFAYFQHDSVTYMFISGGTTSGLSDDLVIKLTGVALPSSAPTVETTTATSGVLGLGA
jgi:hypothetical protein